MEYKKTIHLLDKIMRVSKNSQQNHSETITNEHDKEYIYIQKKDRKLLMI